MMLWWRDKTKKKWEKTREGAEEKSKEEGNILDSIKEETE